MEAAETVNVDVEVLDPGVMEVGENVQFRPAGKPEHDKLMELLNPPTALELTESEVEPPIEIVALCADSAKEKSAFVAADAGTNVAKSPVV